MTRDEIITLLRGWVVRFAIDPYDASAIRQEMDADGMDAETLSDHLDGLGYPELAEEVLKP